ncbi:MAG: type II secretion system protein J, partial [Isosphaeraceae bacterium]
MPLIPLKNRTGRRGVTLVEMLVTVALLVLMMSVIVKVFVAATEAVSASRVFQELDGSLRQFDATIRQDLTNVTVQKFTPPLDPKANQGYFEYAENSFADNQGEDSDDTLRFTVKAPEGQYFTGRFWPNLTSISGVSAMDANQFQSYLRAHP